MKMLKLLENFKLYQIRKYKVLIRTMIIS